MAILIKNDYIRSLKIMNLFHTGAELLIGFIGLFCVTKMFGKMTITQITTFDFISALILGELVGNALYDEEIGLLEILFGIFFWGLLMFLLQIIIQKSIKARGILEGNPSIIVNKGKLNYKELKKNHMDIDQFLHLLREKDTFTIREVEYAILETNGTVSVLKKSDYEIPTKADHRMSTTSPSLPITLISDGRLLKTNLKWSGHNEEWLKKELRVKNIENYKQVLLAEWQKGKTIYIEKY
jgi:uncharacterized membrane protein YcaP (DUF421 family)